MAFCAGGSLNSKQPRCCCCCCSRPAGGSAPLRGSEHAAATRGPPGRSFGAGVSLASGPLWPGRCLCGPLFVPGSGWWCPAGGSGASRGRPLLPSALPGSVCSSSQLRRSRRSSVPRGARGEEALWGCSLGKPRLPAAAAAARCHPRLEERVSGPALPDEGLAAAASAPCVGALLVVCVGWEPCSAPPGGTQPPFAYTVKGARSPGARMHRSGAFSPTKQRRASRT